MGNTASKLSTIAETRAMKWRAHRELEGLIPLFADLLQTIALVVVKRDANQGQVRVRRRLDVIAGEDAEPS